MTNISRKAKRAALASPAKPRRQSPPPAFDPANDPLFRVVSDMETPLGDLRNLLEAARYTAGGLSANYEDDAAAALNGLVDALQLQYHAIRTVWERAAAARPTRQEG